MFSVIAKKCEAGESGASLCFTIKTKFYTGNEAFFCAI